MAVALITADGLGNRWKAVDLARRAISMAPDRWHLHANAAIVALACGRPLVAAAFVRQAMRMAPRQPDSWRIAAQCQLALGDLSEGQASLRASLALAPEQPAVIADLAFLQARRGNLDEAVALHGTAITAAPANDVLLLTAGRSANLRTMYFPAVGVGAILGMPLSVLGAFAGAFVAGRALNALDERRVGEGKAPLLLPKRFAAQPGMGRAVVEYRKRLLRREHVGPVIGARSWWHVALAALAALIGAVVATDGDPVGWWWVAGAPALVGYAIRRRRSSRAITAVGQGPGDRVRR